MNTVNKTKSDFTLKDGAIVAGILGFMVGVAFLVIFFFYSVIKLIIGDTDFSDKTDFLTKKLSSNEKVVIKIFDRNIGSPDILKNSITLSDKSKWSVNVDMETLSDGSTIYNFDEIVREGGVLRGSYTQFYYFKNDKLVEKLIH